MKLACKSLKHWQPIDVSENFATLLFNGPDIAVMISNISAV